MNFKKFSIPAIVLSGIMLAGCSDKEPEKEPVETEVTTEVTETEATGENGAETAVEEPAESDAVEDVNNENNAVTIVQTYFEGINEEDSEKINSVYEDEASATGYKELFASYDIKTEIESYEVVAQSETEWEFDVKVHFTDESGSEGYNDNISTYNIKVNTETQKITYLEITGTQDK